MKIPKNIALFAMGGSGYVGLEFLWRGRSHWSMFLAGGICFLLLGLLDRSPLPRLIKIGLGALTITGVELATGLTLNRDFRVWDYRSLPGNFLGQICPLYTALWLPVAWMGMELYKAAEKRMRTL